MADIKLGNLLYKDNTAPVDDTNPVSVKDEQSKTTLEQIDQRLQTLEDTVDENGNQKVAQYGNKASLGANAEVQVAKATRGMRIDFSSTGDKLNPDDEVIVVDVSGYGEIKTIQFATTERASSGCNVYIDENEISVGADGWRQFGRVSDMREGLGDVGPVVLTKDDEENDEYAMFWKPLGTYSKSFQVEVYVSTTADEPKAVACAVIYTVGSSEKIEYEFKGNEQAKEIRSLLASSLDCDVDAFSVVKKGKELDVFFRKYSKKIINEIMFENFDVNLKH